MMTVFIWVLMFLLLVDVLVRIGTSQGHRSAVNHARVRPCVVCARPVLHDRGHVDVGGQRDGARGL
jgi:hypothetical protein